MRTIYRLKAQEISMAFLKSLKTLFAGQEVEITVKPVNNTIKSRTEILQTIQENSNNAPVISQDINIRDLIDESQYPSN